MLLVSNVWLLRRDVTSESHDVRTEVLLVVDLADNIAEAFLAGDVVARGKEKTVS